MNKIDARLSQIEMYVTKTDDVQAFLQSIACKVNALESDVKMVDSCSNELEESLQA